MNTYFNIPYNFSNEDIFRQIDDGIAQNKAGYICVADGNILQKVHRDREYREVINGSMFSICDSSWVPVFIRWIHGIRIQQYCGSQIFEDAIKRRKYRMMFLGTSEKILSPLKEKLVKQYDERISDMVFYELPFHCVDEFDYKTIAEMVNKDNPDIIWVALGAPKQEIFVSRLKPYLNRGIMIAVGAVFKFYSGVSENRAPAWLVKHHMEFIYRICSSPRKQLPRCLKILTALPSILYKEYSLKKKSFS